ncbi:MAG TPA: response regulator [Opitutaceae bacterium]|jgi:two-component system cell cycle sensor histidine kinase/response regulator CckA|nr:response regulator [Opitutaceae bacterium]
MTNPPYGNPSVSGVPDGISAELFPAAWEKLPFGLCLVDERGAIVTINPAFADLLGYNRTELVGAMFTMLFPPEASVQGLAAHAAFLAGDNNALKTFSAIIHKSGRALFAHTTDARLTLAGRPYRLFSLIDLAREAQTEPQLRQLQRAESFAAMASEVGNDFNNLLSIILGYTTFLQDPAVDSGRAATAIDGIEKAVARAANLIKQTLYLSRKIEPTFQRAQLGLLVENFCQMIGDSYGKQLTLVRSTEPALPPVAVDLYQINHLLLNLCQKSRDLAGPGGRLEFAVSAVAGAELSKKYPDAREPKYDLLRIRLTPPESTDEDTLETFNSAALGLTERVRDLSILAVHSIMSVHRGWLDVSAFPGELVFSLYFPASPELAAEPAVPVAAAAAPVAPRAERVILLVDDEETLLHALSHVLERNGCRVFKARDGIEAVEVFRLRHAEIGLVLCDLGLPRMSGWEAFMKMRDLVPSVDAIFMSGHLEENLQAEIIKSGARGYLQKPFAISEVLAAVNRFFTTGS